MPPFCPPANLSSNPVIAVLDIEYNELTQAWKRLQEFLALENQVEFQERPQDYRDLSRVVRCVQDGWVSSPNQPTFTRCISLCDDFLSTVDPHSLLLATLPDCEFYLSLFYGAVQSIIKVGFLAADNCG